MQLFDFAFFRDYDTVVDDLAKNLADREVWGFSNSAPGKHPILRNYLDHTFRRLEQENKIKYTDNNTHSSFHTGLYTKNDEDIVALFSANSYSGPDRSPWVFEKFAKVSDNYFLTHFCDNKPERADYFEEPASLLFNPNFEVVKDIDHIIEDNISRFPQHLQGADNAQLRIQLNGSVDIAVNKVRSNYKIAVPQYYKGHIQLLLPLCLTPGSPKPDLALVLSKIGEKTYKAHTCLTLRMAFNNARLIVKPQSEWLKPV